MNNEIVINVPDIGDFTEVAVIELFVKPGDEITAEDPVMALESDKATMEIPAQQAGKIISIHVKAGDMVSEGSMILTLELASESAIKKETEPTEQVTAQENQSIDSNVQATNAPTTRANTDIDTQLVVLGSGPGGYTAAFRAADLGLQVTLIERYETIGGVCLNVGCIPSKALLHAAKVIEESASAKSIGLTFAPPETDLEVLREWKSSVVKKLTQGLKALAKQRKVNIVRGTGVFTDSNTVSVTSDEGETSIGFEQAIIAAGSQPVHVPSFPHDDPKVIDSTGALELHDVPKRLLIIGGGIIGLEMATVYHALGSKVSIVEMQSELMAGADSDVLRPLKKKITKQYENIWLNTRVVDMIVNNETVTVSFDGEKAPKTDQFDRVLVSVGRVPNGLKINADAAGVTVSEKGFIDVNAQMQTNVPHIFAIGDIVGQPMLAHKAVHEGKVAAEVAAGLKSGFDARVIPSVAYTDPEVAWVGETELSAKQKNLPYEKGVFPWAASGRSLSQGSGEGITKLLFDPETDRIIGAGITGSNAGDLIAEVALAIEMNADASDLALTVHAHPTLAETIGFAAEAFEGTITDLYLPKKKT